MSGEPDTLPGSLPQHRAKAGGISRAVNLNRNRRPGSRDPHRIIRELRRWLLRQTSRPRARRNKKG
jgi:hypothetical protein